MEDCENLDIWEMVKCLPTQRMKDIIIYYHCQGFSYRQIARTMKIGLATVKRDKDAAYQIIGRHYGPNGTRNGIYEGNKTRSE